MIGIPGVTKEKTSVESKKSSPAKASKENDKSKTSTSGVKPEDAKPEAPAKERKHRPKVFNTGKSRSLGLLQDMEQTLDKSKASKLKKEEEGGPIPDVELPTGLLPPSAGKPTKRPSIDGLIKPGDAKKAKLSDEKEKKEAKKAKIIGIQESSLFMEAINIASSNSSKPSRSKRRTSSTGEKELLTPPVIIGPSGSGKSGKGKVSSPADEEPVKPVFNFYRDTLTEEAEPKKEEAPEEPTLTSQDKDKDCSPDGSDDSKMETGDDAEPVVDSFVPDDDDGKLRSALVIHRSKNKPKKTVRWREEDELKEFHFFEMDDTERVNVSRKNFAEMKSQERSEERQAIKRNLFGVDDKMEEKLPWKTPAPIIFVKEIPELPITSLEQLAQEEREKGILGVVYFSKSQIPDSPEEPEDVLVLNQDDTSK
jgi:hypothetical protein